MLGFLFVCFGFVGVGWLVLGEWGFFVCFSGVSFVIRFITASAEKYEALPALGVQGFRG